MKANTPQTSYVTAGKVLMHSYHLFHWQSYGEQTAPNAACISNSPKSIQNKLWGLFFSLFQSAMYTFQTQ